MAQLRKLHLFNCDRTYKLDAVEDLLAAMKAKLRFDSVEKHYFSLGQMSEMADNIIPELEMDMAFFVVHAHESRLSINEDNAGIGFAKIYRALLEATEGKVIIIIGGDDNYKNKDEEDRVVISRWARRKISSQFREEFLDGSKSFIFSWNKQHRAIHEEALLHYFHPSKKGQKFEYQLERKEMERSKSAQTSNDRSPVQKYQSLDEGIEHSNWSSAKQRQEAFPVVRSRSVDDAGEQSSFNRPKISEQTRDDQLFRSTTGTPKVSTDSEYEVKSKEPPSARTGRPEVIELAILGCNVSSDSLKAIMKVFEVIRPRLNLAPNPPVETVGPLEAEQYLIDNHVKFCVLAVDSETIRDAYAKLPLRKREYEGLLETAADKVDKMVIILMCGTCAFKSNEDETAVLETIERIINKKEKGFLARLENDGRMSVQPDVLVECLRSTSSAHRPNPQEERNGDASAAAAESYSGQSQNPSDCEPGPGISAQNMLPSILLRSLLRYGKISDKLEDLQVWTPGFIVPEYIRESLLQKQGANPVTGVTIMPDKNGTELRCSVNPKLIEISRSRYEGIEIAADETLILKTRIRNGLVSFEESDVHFWYGNREIPQYIRERLEEEYRSTSNGVLFIISDEKQNFRSIVKIGKLKKFLTFLMEKCNVRLARKL